MLLEILQRALRIEPRIGIVESGDESSETMLSLPP